MPHDWYTLPAAQGGDDAKREKTIREDKKRGHTHTCGRWRTSSGTDRLPSGRCSCGSFKEVKRKRKMNDRRKIKHASDSS